MALTKTHIKNEYGKTLEFEDAYIQVVAYTGDKNGITIQVIIYESKNKVYVLGGGEYLFRPSLENDAPNFIKQAYLYLKTLTEYKDAIDVLEDGQE